MFTLPRTAKSAPDHKVPDCTVYLASADHHVGNSSHDGMQELNCPTCFSVCACFAQVILCPVFRSLSWIERTCAAPSCTQLEHYLRSCEHSSFVCTSSSPCRRSSVSIELLVATCRREGVSSEMAQPDCTHYATDNGAACTSSLPLKSVSPDGAAWLQVPAVTMSSLHAALKHHGLPDVYNCCHLSGCCACC